MALLRPPSQGSEPGSPEDLNVLRDKLMDVRGPDDLGPVFSKLHDDLGDVVSKTASISLF